MTNFTSSISIPDILKFPFQDPDWKKKIATGSLLMLGSMIIPILPMLVVMGYSAQVLRQTLASNGKLSLPEWDDWGRMLLDGLKVWGVNLIFAIPLIILILVGFLGYFLLPVPGMLMANEGDTPWLGMLVTLLGFGGATLVFGLAVILGFAIAIISPAAIGHMIAKDEFTAAFDFKAWWPILKSAFISYVLVFVIVYGISMIISLVSQLFLVTVILCILFPIIMMIGSFLISLYSYSLYGLAYLDGKNKLEA